ncbi:hypothetical protein [Vulcanococcus sp.]|jgi:hypothetical protein|uniref:hypothetical protein n=1 Tax=Vulcanococcus sp. TaxID=2856995 RepID=UPI0037D992A7
MAKRQWRTRLADTLIRWGAALKPAPALVPPPTVLAPQLPDARQQAAISQLPGLRAPLSIEEAVRERDLTVLKREASDALAALAAAHAVVTSARLAQLHNLRQAVERGELEEQEMVDFAGDYQAWQNDQVRLFDALALVLGMAVPEGGAFEQIDEDLLESAEAHLTALGAEYQRRLLSEQFENGQKEG